MYRAIELMTLKDKRESRDKEILDAGDHKLEAANMFYRWQKELFDHGAAAFEVKGRSRRPDGKATKPERENEKLRNTLALKDHVIAARTQEYMPLENAYW